MEISEYLQSQEEVYCQAEVIIDKGLEGDSSGDLACTDSRLVFSEGDSVLDIRLASISEIVTKPPTYLNRFAGWAAIFSILAILAQLILPGIPEAADFTFVATLGFLLIAVVEGALAIYYAKWMVEIKTDRSEYKFLSNDVSLRESLRLSAER